MIEITFITGNENKFRNACKYLDASSQQDTITLVQQDLDPAEIQDDSPENIALYSAKLAAQKIQKPVITSDVAFVIPAFNGFPGPYIKSANSWFTQADFLRIMSGDFDRTAFFVDALAYADPSGRTAVFSSKTMGEIAEQETAGCKWTIDGLFIPDGFDAPLAQLDDEIRATVWNLERWVKMSEFLRSL